MERVVVNRSFTLSKTFYSDGTPATPTGTPTVAIIRANGTTVTTSSVAGTGTGPYTVTVTAGTNTLLDTLTVTWTATIGGQPNTYVDTVEVAGGTLFTIAQAQSVITGATVAQVVEARTYAETELEGAIGYALVPRYTRETITGSLRLGTYTRVRWPNIRAVRDVIVNGTALTAGDIADLTFNQNFIVGWSLMTAATWRNDVLVVGYEHGLDSPPPGASRAALSLATEYLGGGAGSVDPRAERLITDDGTLVFGATGGGAFRAVGVNEWVAANRLAAVA